MIYIFIHLTVRAQWFSALFRSFFLKTEFTSPFFNSEGKVPTNIGLLKLLETNSEKTSVILIVY